MTTYFLLIVTTLTLLCGYYTAASFLLSKLSSFSQFNRQLCLIITTLSIIVTLLVNPSLTYSFNSFLITVLGFTGDVFLIEGLSYSTPDLIYTFELYKTKANLLSSYIDNIDYPYSTEFSFAFTTKLAASLSFLILIRGGVPRYRYDILTKLGWVKFLGFVLAIFILTLVMFFLW